jgi:Phosphotransferase enzyme family
MPMEPHQERETRRIILLRGTNPEVLVGFDGAHHALPQVEIPRRQRVAENLTAALRETCGVEAVSVSSLETPSRESRSEKIRYAIMESLAPGAEAPREKEWVAIDCLVERSFRDPGDFQAAQQAVAQCTAYARETRCGPFGRLGWFPDLQRWVQEQIAAHGLHLNGRLRQLNASPTFCLIRFETDGPAVWFKAVGTPNQREYPVTLALARSFSCFVPQIIATRPECNGWLSLEAEGPILSECTTLAPWKGVAADLAELQIHSLGKSLQLLDPGARDLRAWALADFVEPFFQTMGELMERQNKVPPASLSREELRSLSARVQDALAVLGETRIPTTLGHLDINPGNVICSPVGSVFLDWAEAFVGHPFLTFTYLLEHFRRTLGKHRSQEAQLVAAYTSPWHAFFPETDIRRALKVAPLVAVFAYSTGNDLWTDLQKLEESRAGGCLRSLTRRMEREAHGLVERSVSCPS